MARLASIEKNNKRIALGKKYFAERARLREVVRSLTVSEEEKVEARRKLEKLPRNSATGRSITRCQLSGRPRGNYRKFGLSRIAFRKLALDGKLPGVTKASW